MHMRFAVVGCGSIGKRHVRNLLALGQRDIVGFDPREDRRAEVEALNVQTIGELEKLWDLRPHAVLVTTPTKLHIPVALEAAKRGCHLFIEKPVADVSDAALASLLDEVRTRDLVTLVGCNLRFHPSLVAAKRVLDERRLGRVVSLRAEFGQYLPDWHPWEDYRQGYSARKDLGGGVVLDAIHELDYARWLLGEVTVVGALAGKSSHLAIDTEDVASILLRFASGAFGEVHLDYVQRTASRSCKVVGDEGTLECNLRDIDGVKVYTAATKEWETIPPPQGWETNQMYVDELKHFLACLSRAEKPHQDVFEAARVLEIALAAKTSAESESFLRPGHRL